MNRWPILALLLLCIACNDKKEEKEKFSIKQKQATPMELSAKNGKEIYNSLCISCHLSSGKGVVGAFPPLNPSDWITDRRPESIRAIKYGLKGKIAVNGKPYDGVMLPLGLDDQEIADVMNYVIQEWNNGPMVTKDEVQSATKNK